MKIVCTKADLSQAIGLTLNAVSSKSTLPVLGNLLFEVSGKEVQITGTDLEIGLRTKMAAEILKEGSITIPAKKISDLVRECPDQDIEITLGENEDIKIRYGKGRYSIKGLKAEDFPSLPEAKDGSSLEISEQDLLEMIKKVSFSVSTDETRYVLNGALLMAEGNKVLMVSTDGHRLSKTSKSLEKSQEKVNVVLPTKALVEIQRVLVGGENKVTVHLSNNHLFLEKGPNILVTRLIDGQFPNYEQVIPKNTDKVMTAVTEELAKVVRRVSLMASDKSKSVKFSLSKNKLTVSSQTPDVGEAEEEMDVEYDGEALAIAFNGAYVSEALKVLASEKAELKLSSSLSPGLLTAAGGGESEYVIMPMRT